MKTIWTISIRCPEGHTWSATDPEVNVDGHAVVPLPGLCERCLGTPRTPTWRERRAMKRFLRDL